MTQVEECPTPRLGHGRLHTAPCYKLPDLPSPGHPHSVLAAPSTGSPSHARTPGTATPCCTRGTAGVRRAHAQPAQVAAALRARLRLRPRQPPSSTRATPPPRRSASDRRLTSPFLNKVHETRASHAGQNPKPVMMSSRRPREPLQTREFGLGFCNLSEKSELCEKKPK